MIKRALGVFNAKAPGTSAPDEDSDDELAPKELSRLHKKFLPGARGAPKAKKAQAPVVEEDEVDEEDVEEDEEEESEDDEDNDDDAESDGDIDHPVMPPEADAGVFRGKFKCQLCPHKVLLTEKAMEDHLQSDMHKRNEKRFKHAKEIGVDSYQQECRERAEARQHAEEDSAAGLTKKKEKNFLYWQKKREKQLKTKKRNTGDAKELDADEQEAAKLKFQAKKARRKAKREAGEAPQLAQPKDDVANGRPQQHSLSSEGKPLNRAQRRALKFGHATTPGSDVVNAKTPKEASNKAAKAKAALEPSGASVGKQQKKKKAAGAVDEPAEAPVKKKKKKVLA